MVAEICVRPHEPTDVGRAGILYFEAKSQRVQGFFGARFTNFKVEVGAHGATGVAGKGDELFTFDREEGGVWVDVTVVFASLTEVVFHIGFNLWGEGVEVAIDGGVAFRVADVEGVAVAVGADGDAADVAVGDRSYAESAAALGLNVDAAVEVVATQLGEGSAEDNWYF